jgi:phosphatidylinositol alpha-1,6-mannosyltransferase
VREPQHVVFLATDFRPMIGGIAESLHQLAHHLARHVPVTVMTSVAQNGSAGATAYRLLQLPALPERRLGRRVGDGVPPIRKLHTGAYFVQLWSEARRTAAAVKQTSNRPLVVVGSWDTASHFWCAACRHAGLPYCLVVNGGELVWPLYGPLPRWQREDFTGADRVLAISHATANLAVERLALSTPPVVLYVAVGPRPADDEVRPRSTALRRQLQLDGRTPVLLSLGRLIRRKGFDLVLQAVADLAVEFPALTYVIAGEGPERTSLEALTRTLGIADRIRLVGQVDDLTKWALYDLCDVFVMPNRLLEGTDWEGFGIVFVEAALASRPVIAGRTGGTADAVADEGSGLLIDPELQGEVTSAVRRLLRDGALRDQFGKRGEQMARTRFAGDVVAGRLWDAIR